MRTMRVKSAIVILIIPIALGAVARAAEPPAERQIGPQDLTMEKLEEQLRQINPELVRHPYPHLVGRNGVLGHYDHFHGCLQYKDREFRGYHSGRMELNPVQWFYVDVNGRGAAKGTAEAPFRSITEALAAVKRHYETQKPKLKQDRGNKFLDHPCYFIFVADGRYTHETEAFGQEGLAIEVPVWIFGGRGKQGTWKPFPRGRSAHVRGGPQDMFAGLETIRTSGRGTIIDLGGKGRAFHTAGGWLRLDGCTIRGGRADEGGAVKFTPLPREVRKQWASGREKFTNLIKDCTLEDNRATRRGGAVSVQGVDPWIVNCTLRGNRAGSDEDEEGEAQGAGGAVYAEGGGQAKFFLCRLYGNEATRGGAAAFRRAFGWMRNTLVYANRGQYALEWLEAEYDGDRNGHRMLINYTTVSDNHGGGIGWFGTIAREGLVTPVCIRQSIVAFNEGAGIHKSGGPAGSRLSFDDVYANAGGNCSGVNFTTTNISMDPKFVDRTNADLARRDYAPRADSPVILAARHYCGGEYGFRANYVYQGKCTSDMDIGACRCIPRREGDPPRPERDRTPWDTYACYVDKEWTGEEKGTADAPFRSVTAALRHMIYKAGRKTPFAPPAPTIIYVADGLYDRQVEEYGTLGLVLYIGNDNGGGGCYSIEIKGSYTGHVGNGEFDWTTRGRRTTVFDPAGQSRAFQVQDLDTGTKAVFENLAFVNGRFGPSAAFRYAHGGPGMSPLGGGAICHGAEESWLILIDCLFRDNHSDGFGGAVSFRNEDNGHVASWPLRTRAGIINCDFINNHAETDGGAIYGLQDECQRYSLPIRNCRFEGNTAGRSGGAAWLAVDTDWADNPAIVSNCLFRDNRAGNLGGALACYGRIDMQRCMFYGNEAKRGAALCELNLSEEKIGGGYTTVSTDPWVIEDCLLYGNRGGYAIEYELRRRGKEPWQWYPDAAGLTLRRCTIADNASGGVYYRAGYPKPLIPWAKTEADYKRHLEGPWGYLEKAYAPLVADGNVIAGNEGEGLDFSDGGTPAEATLSGNIIADNAKGDVKGLAEGKGYTSPKVAFVRPETPRLWERSYVLSGKGSGNANVGAPCRLLEYLAGSETEAALSKIRAGLKSNDPAHRAAALEALAEWTRTDVREELLAAAKDATDEQARVAAFAGYARLLLHPARLPSIWHAPPEMPQAKRAALVEEALPLAKTDAERQALRRGQAGMPGCPRYEAPLAGEAPKLDGKLDDAVWRRAEPAKLREAWEGPLQAHRAALAGKEPNVPEAPTEVRIAHDRQYCYFAIRCNAPNQRSGQVVISLDPHGRFSEYYQFRIDAKGTVRSLHAPLWRQDPTWNADVRTATQQGENHWTAEVAIPWSDLKVSPKPGRQVRFQVAHHRAGAHSQFPVTSFPGTRSLGKYPEGDSVTDFYTYGYADLGEAKILDNGCSTGSPWGAPCMDAINTYYGRPDTPVGTLTGKDR